MNANTRAPVGDSGVRSSEAVASALASSRSARVILALNNFSARAACASASNGMNRSATSGARSRVTDATLLAVATAATTTAAGRTIPNRFQDQT